MKERRERESESERERKRESEREVDKKGLLQRGRIKATNPDQVTSSHYLFSNGIDQLREKFETGY